MNKLEKEIYNIYLKYESHETVIKKVVALIRKEIGFKLLTFMIFSNNQKFAKRIYSSDENKYPIGKSKKLPNNYWAVMTVQKRRSFIGNNKKIIEKYFYDHKIITSLGCEAILNQVVTYNKKTIGCINILHKKNYFTKIHQEKMNIISKCVVALFLDKQKEIK
ncbi:MAG: hypothetical protein HOC10_06305 [Pelagibacteraceae bacterium]|nr:hypothetical protein [Pelagibacteraceae bacterium]